MYVTARTRNSENRIWRKQENRHAFAASIALATVMNCCGETEVSNQRLRKVSKEPDRRFDISTPLSNASNFHPSFSFPTLLQSEADKSSCMQFSLAKWTYLLNESSLIDLYNHKAIITNQNKTWLCSRLSIMNER